MESLDAVHDSLQRRLQIMERKISLISIQLGQVLDILHRASVKDANKQFFEELDAATFIRPVSPAKPDGQGTEQTRI